MELHFEHLSLRSRRATDHLPVFTSKNILHYFSLNLSDQRSFGTGKNSKYFVEDS